MFQKMYEVYALLERLPLIGLFFRKCSYPIQFILFYCFNRQSRRQWSLRVRDVMACPDNAYIPRSPSAGKVVNGHLIMHNGIKISRGSYYGVGIHVLLKENRGVHEPQEERVFMEVLKCMPKDALMVELGAYWGFYSMWFHKQVINPSCYLIEPEMRNLEFGRSNFGINSMEGKFLRGFIGASSGRTDEGVPTICVDDFVVEHEIKHINILHSDIQGAEFDMLLGARKVFDLGIIDYVFISTHTNDLHNKCRYFLLEHGLVILADADLNETYSEDGMIVGRRNGLEGPMPITISKKPLRIFQYKSIFTMLRECAQ